MIAAGNAAMTISTTRSSSSLCMLAGLVALTLGVRIAPAQHASPRVGEEDPALNDASLDRVVQEQQHRPAPPTELAPAQDDRPPAESLPAAPSPSALPPIPLPVTGTGKGRSYPEGTFLVRRPGSLFRLSSGDSVFVPLRDAQGRGDTPMILLPGQTLARLESSAAALSAHSTVVISGQAFVYQNRSYLLPTLFSIQRQEAAAPAPARPNVAADEDPMIAELLKEIEPDQASPARPAPPATTEAPSSPTTGKGGQHVLPEGTVLVNRLGRLVRVDGQPGIAFDGGTKNPAEPAMPLLRCRMLQRIEQIAAGRGDSLTLQVSGRVTVYHGRNYLLPTFVQATSVQEVRSLQ